jgi:hypothetical protein
MCRVWRQWLPCHAESIRREKVDTEPPWEMIGRETSAPKAHKGYA